MALREEREGCAATRAGQGVETGRDSCSRGRGPQSLRTACRPPPSSRPVVQLVAQGTVHHLCPHLLQAVRRGQRLWGRGDQGLADHYGGPGTEEALPTSKVPRLCQGKDQKENSSGFFWVFPPK